MIQAGFKGLKARKHKSTAKQAAASTVSQATDGRESSGPLHTSLSVEERNHNGQTKQDIDGNHKERSPAKQESVKTAGEACGEADRQPSVSQREPGGPPAPAAEQAEEIDIDLEDPDVEKAALKIQGAFKGLKGRKKAKNSDTKPETTFAAGAGSGERTLCEENPTVADKDRAGGEVAAQSSSAGPASGGDNAKAPQSESAPEEEVIDIDLNDPDVEKAALKIQAKFKGFRGGKAKMTSAKHSVKQESVKPQSADPSHSPQATSHQTADFSRSQEASPNSKSALNAAHDTPAQVSSPKVLLTQRVCAV